MDRRSFLLRTAAAGSVVPFSFATPASAYLAPVLWWVGRRFFGAILTPVIRRRVLGTATFAGSSTAAWAGNELANGLSREFVTNPLYDVLSDPAYQRFADAPTSGFSSLTPQYAPIIVNSGRDGSSELQYPAPPPGTAVMTRDHHGNLVDEMSNFEGDFLLHAAGDVPLRGQFVTMRVVDIDTGEEIVFDRKQYVSRKMLQEDGVPYHIDQMLLPGRKMLVGYDEDGHLVIGGDIFYVAAV